MEKGREEPGGLPLRKKGGGGVSAAEDSEIIAQNRLCMVLEWDFRNA